MNLAALLPRGRSFFVQEVMDRSPPGELMAANRRVGKLRGAML
jgi:hypothetical protein